MLLTFIATPQLTATTLIPTSSSIMVSWTAPQFAPNSFSISYFCQRLCGSPPTQGTKILHNGEAIDYTLTQIPSSAICNISVVAVFGSNKNSNTVTSSTNTKPAGAHFKPRAYIYIMSCDAMHVMNTSHAQCINIGLVLIFGFFSS